MQKSQHPLGATQAPHQSSIYNLNERRIIRREEILSRSGLSAATQWRLENQGQFPQRVQLGGNSVGWFSDEFDAWLDKKSLERYDTNKPPRRAIKLSSYPRRKKQISK